MVNHAAGEVIGSNKLTHRAPDAHRRKYIQKTLRGSDSVRERKKLGVFTKHYSEINSRGGHGPGTF